MEGIEFIKEVEIMKVKSFRELQDFVYDEPKETLNLSKIKKSSYVKNVSKISNNSFKIELNSSKKIACGVAHKMAYDIISSNPFIDLQLDDDLMSMEKNEDLIFKSKNPLWALKSKGSTLILQRLF